MLHGPLNVGTVDVFRWEFENSLLMQNGSTQPYVTPHTAHSLIY